MSSNIKGDDGTLGSSHSGGKIKYAVSTESTPQDYFNYALIRELYSEILINKSQKQTDHTRVTDRASKKTDPRNVNEPVYLRIPYIF